MVNTIDQLEIVIMVDVCGIEALVFGGVKTSRQMDNNKKWVPNRTFFKKCPKCGTRWNTRNAFLADSELDIIGYQVDFRELTAGLFFFNHSCKGTFTIYANEFIDLYQGPIFEDRATGSDECPGYCLRKNYLEPCPVKCECAFVREVLQIIRNWPRREK